MSTDAARPVSVLRLGGGSAELVADAVAVEEPLEIRAAHGPAINRRRASLSTTLRTPGHDRELVAGFLLAEAVVDSPADLLELRTGSDPNVLTAELHPDLELDLSRLGRHTLTSGACGVCGKTILDALAERAEAVPISWQVPAEWVASLPGQLRPMQPLFDATGGVHAAGLAAHSQGISAVYEDIGRHNALDKLLGAEFLAGRLPATGCAVVVSGRAGFELVQKCARAGVAMLVAVGAPTSLAVELADAMGVTLVGFARGGRCTVYSGRGRIGPGGETSPPVPLSQKERG